VGGGWQRPNPFANPAALAVLGYDSAEELFGRDSHETIHYKHPDGTPYPAAECPMLLPQTTGEVVKSDLDWFFRRDGSMFPVSYVSVPIELREGRGAVVAFTDIEDRMRAEQVLREHDAVLASREGSLRRIATLVAGGAASAEVFAAIAREVAQVLGVALVAVWRYESDGTGTVVGAWSEPPNLLEIGSRWPLDDTVIISRVRETGRPARSDDLAEVHGTVANIVREAVIRSAAGAPIVVDGDVWGVMAAGGTEGERLGPHRGSARGVHGAGRHDDLEQREPAGACPARGRAGRAAPRGDAGRPRRPAAGGVCGGRA
jgi:PAS domain S-box-containing protein